MTQAPLFDPTRAIPAPRVSASVADLRNMAAVAGQGLIPVYTPGRGIDYVPATAESAALSCGWGAQELINLSDDLLLVRTDWREMPAMALRYNRWDYDNRGWLYVHFRLDGLSEDETPAGTRRTVDGECFLLSASTFPRPFAREVLGDSWRTVGVACRPSFVMRDLPISGDGLPTELRRFQSGDPDVDFYFAGQLTHDMKSAVTMLLHPTVQGRMRPIYLQAKVVELLCLAMDRLRQSDAATDKPLRLSRRDVVCLHEIRRLLRDGQTPPSLEELARRVGLNRRKLALGFKQVFGVTVGAYNRELRLEMAREALETQAMSIGRAAVIAGYCDAGSFSKAFRARYGCLPSELKAESMAMRSTDLGKQGDPETE